MKKELNGPVDDLLGKRVMMGRTRTGNSVIKKVKMKHVTRQRNV